MTLNKTLVHWLKEHNITEVEIFVPDLSGIMRGKIIPCEKFIQSSVRMPESALAQTLTGDWGEQDDLMDEADGDMELRPDPEGCFVVPWADEPTGQIICDCVSRKGSLIRYAPRSVLKKVIRFFHREGWQPIVAPELEFYLATRDNNPDNPLTPPVGRTGRPEFSRQPFNIDALNEFEPIINDIYRFAEAQELAVDTLTHEEGVAQFEINFKHGDALELADQVLMFKRCVREAAVRHNMAATFMAKPVEGQPGSSMHIHQSVVSRTGGHNLFASSHGTMSTMFKHYIGGLQRYLPDIAAMLIPNINSYRRINVPWQSNNNHWGVNNRTVGLRVPDIGEVESMRVENRISGSDANPYLAIAASLLAGFVGIKQKLPLAAMVTSATWDMKRGIPLTLEQALENMQKSKMLREKLGNRFVDIYVACKRTELENYKHVVTAWERKFLLDI
ncbi:glutamine synthetase family protein [Candidatus Persebacteraceae bacterium Df01]|uniref:Glutamine synthetase family protein n=1 Tax=Candidatus Doriopsillibacter californiensis TaxID=2970740 RepID=A0ABT7QMH8_9GAMM|nr:glutamine synthetase family protein [Candidatus Persebacteraceae bacterium Df01]